MKIHHEHEDTVINILMTMSNNNATTSHNKADKLSLPDNATTVGNLECLTQETLNEELNELCKTEKNLREVLKLTQRELNLTDIEWTQLKNTVSSLTRHTQQLNDINTQQSSHTNSINFEDIASINAKEIDLELLQYDIAKQKKEETTDLSDTELP